MSEEKMHRAVMTAKETIGRTFDEADLLPLSRLADLEFCERRAALHLIEMAWEDNIHTAEGTVMHEHVHGDHSAEKRGDVIIIICGLWLRSLRLGLSDKADVVELHRTDNTDSRGCRIPGHAGHWRVYPVEYKPGRLKHQLSFQIQLCAQALCLEEMLGCSVPEGAIYYGQPRRRLDVVFDEALRSKTEEAAGQLHEMVASGRTPPARYEKKCESCSLISLCMPKITGGRRSVEGYLAKVLSQGG